MSTQMNPISHTPDKFGFYQIGDARFFSLQEAFEHQRIFKTGTIKWNFNRTVFDNFDWKTEPKKTLIELYEDRCRQIRENYDYVVLFYSGGSDSHNMLTSWLNAGLKIDEIATMWSVEGSKDKDFFQEAEVNRVVLPTVQKLKEAGVEFKFRQIDRSANILKYFNTFKGEWLYHINRYTTPNSASLGILRDVIDDYKNIIASGKKLCFVWGCEKPNIAYDQRRMKYYTYFNDIIDHCVSPYVQDRYSQGWYDELFYWTPDMPEIICKQMHILKQFCYLQPQAIVTENVKRILLYPFWDMNTFTAGKIKNNPFSARDHWFVTSNLDEFKLFLDGVNHLQKTRNSIEIIGKSVSPNYYV